MAAVVLGPNVVVSVGPGYWGDAVSLYLWGDEGYIFGHHKREGYQRIAGARKNLIFRNMTVLSDDRWY